MKKTSTIITITCDICGSECQPVREINVPVKYYMDQITSVKAKICAHVPYGTDSGDVCEQCAKSALIKWATGSGDTREIRVMIDNDVVREVARWHRNRDSAPG